MKLSIKAGATSQSVNVFVQDSSSTVGAGLSGLVYNTSGLIAYYTFAGANCTATAITLATLAAVNSAFSSGGLKEIDATHMPGLYRLDVPNAALAGGNGRCVTVVLGGAANMAPCVLEIELTGWDNQDAVHGGLSALPNTACTTNASLLTSGTGTDQLHVSSGHVANVDTLTTYTGNTVQTGDAYVRLGAPAGASVAADIAGVKGDTATILTDVNAGAGAIYTRLGAPAGASLAADVAAVKSSVGSPLQAGSAPANFGLLAIDGGGRVDVSAFNGHTTVGGKDWYHALWYVTAVTAGQLPAGAGSGVETWQDFGGVAAVAFTVDASGNRTGAYS